jgi:hypothetical protein
VIKPVWLKKSREHKRTTTMKLMTAKALQMTTAAMLPAALLIFTSCSSTSPEVGSSRIIYSKGVPGGTILQTIKTTATVTAIDQAKRTATLSGSDGKKFTVKVGAAAVNFDRVRVGDQVNATVEQKLVAYLDKEGATSGEGSAAVVALAGKGDQPGGLVAETIQKTGKVIAIDSEKRTTTLQFADGYTETLPVRADIDLGKHKVGEQIVFRVTDMIAIWVEKP